MICVTDENNGDKYQLFKGEPKQETPKTWKKIRIMKFKEFPSDNYNTNVFSIYITTTRSLRYSVYHDGCFYEYYGKLIKQK